LLAGILYGVVSTRAPAGALPIAFAFFDAMVGGVRNSLIAENFRLEGVELSEGDVDGTPDDTAEDLASSSLIF